MGVMVYSFLWVMQDFDHQPYLMASHFFSEEPQICASCPGAESPLNFGLDSAFRGVYTATNTTADDISPAFPEGP